MKIEDIKIGMTVSHALCASSDRFQVVEIVNAKKGLVSNKVLKYKNNPADLGCLDEYNEGDLVKHLASYLTPVIDTDYRTSIRSKYKF